MASKTQDPKGQQERAGAKKGARTMVDGIAHSVNHPIRLDALSILFERTASPKEIAKQIEAPLATVAFHISELADGGAVKLVKTEPRRGAVEHFYRATRQPDVSEAEWRSMSKRSRRKLAGALLQAIVAESLSSLRHGCMDEDEHLHITWMPMRVDEKGRAELAKAQEEMLKRYTAIRERSAKRLSEDDGTTVVAATLGFNRARPAAAPRRGKKKRS